MNPVLRAFLFVLALAGPVAAARAEGDWRRIAMDRVALEIPAGWVLVATGDATFVTPDARAPDAPRIALLAHPVTAVLAGADISDRAPLALDGSTAEVVAVRDGDRLGWHLGLPRGGTLSLTAAADAWESVEPVFEHALATVAAQEPPAGPVPAIAGPWQAAEAAVQVIAAGDGAWFRIGTAGGGIDLQRRAPDLLVAEPGPLGEGRIAADGMRIDWADGSVWTRPRPGTSVWRPEGAPVTAALTGTAALRAGPDRPALFQVLDTARLESVRTWHGHDGSGARPGEIGLAGPDGATFGPWPAERVPDPGGAGASVWEVRPGIVLGPGDHVVADSDPASWSTSDEAGGRGHFSVTLQPLRDEPTDGTLFPAALGELWRPLSSVGGDFDRFARLTGEALRVEVPEGQRLGKTGISTTRPILDLRWGPAAMGFDLIPEATDSFVLTFGPTDQPEEWTDHTFRFAWSRAADGRSGTASLHVGASLVAERSTGPEAPARVEMRADPAGAIGFLLGDGQWIEGRAAADSLAQPMFVYALAHAPGDGMAARFGLAGVQVLPAAAAAVPPVLWAPPVAGEQVLFDGRMGLRWVGHAMRGVDFARVARFTKDGMRVEVPEGMVTAAAGILSPDPLVWLDGFGPGAQADLTFTIDPAGTDGFVLALSQPGWGGVAGNGPGEPGVHFVWLRRPDGPPVAEFHVTPHPEGDFDRREMTGDAPETVTLTLRPGTVRVSAPGMEPFERPFDFARDGVGLRLYAYSAAAAENAPARFALKRVTLRRTPARLPDAAGDAMAPLPVRQVFDGTETPFWKPFGLGGGDFAAFAAYRDGALRIEVPEGRSWGRTGLLSDTPLLPVDDRLWRAPWRIALQLDRAVPQNMVVALTPTRTEEMWPDHRGWFTFSYLPDRDIWIMGLHVSPYREWSREIPGAWMARHWDGRLSSMWAPAGPRSPSPAARA